MRQLCLRDRMRHARETVGDDISRRWLLVMAELEKDDITEYVVASEEIGRTMGLYGVDEFVNNTKCNAIDHCDDGLNDQWESVIFDGMSHHDARERYKGGKRIFALEIFMKVFPKDWVLLYNNAIEWMFRELCVMSNKALMKGHKNWLQEYFEEAYSNGFLCSMSNMAYNRIKNNSIYTPVKMPDGNIIDVIFPPQAINFRTKGKPKRASYTNVGYVSAGSLFTFSKIDKASEETKDALEKGMRCTIGEINAFVNLKEFMELVYGKTGSATYISTGELLFNPLRGKECRL